MKILHILDHSLPLHSGYTFRSQNIFQEQVRRGWKPVVITSPKHEENMKKQIPPMEEINGIKYYRCGMRRGLSGPILEEFNLMHSLAKRVEEICLKEKPDIIHAHSPVLNAFPALWVGKKLALPVVYEIRAFWEDAAVDHGSTREGSARYRITRLMETQVAKRVSHLCVICKGLRNDLIRRGISSSKITVIYNGINPEHFQRTVRAVSFGDEWGLKDKRVIGFVGSFYRYEGLDLLVKVFAKLGDKYPDIVLLLVGGGEMQSELLKVLHSPKVSRVSKRIVIPGRVSHETISGVYSLIDILVYPRYSVRLTELVTPLKPLEAMAMRKALVASDVGGHRELIKDGVTGCLFRAGDGADLFGKLDDLLCDATFRNALARRAFEWVTGHHTWAKTTQPYEDVYDKVLSPGRK